MTRPAPRGTRCCDRMVSCQPRPSVGPLQLLPRSSRGDRGRARFAVAGPTAASADAPGRNRDLRRTVRLTRRGRPCCDHLTRCQPRPRIGPLPLLCLLLCAENIAVGEPLARWLDGAAARERGAGGIMPSQPRTQRPCAACAPRRARRLALQDEKWRPVKVTCGAYRAGIQTGGEVFEIGALA